MRGDDEVPHVEYDGEECVAMCKSKLRAKLDDSTTPDEILHEFQTYCESQDMQDFCNLHGVLGTKFEWNPHLQCRRRLSLFRRQRHGKLYTQFWKAYQENPTLNLGLAFHGTAESNVNKILHYGMDPQYRRTQAFGNGEYFSKEPGLSATYRHEGHCLLVFLLLVPKDHEKLFSQKDRDIIVVPDLTHQLPLGVLRFQDVDEHKIQHSQQMRLEQRHLKEAAVECDWHITEAKMVQEVVECLKNGQFNQASDCLRQATKYHKLSEIVQEYLTGKVEEYIREPEVRVALFPALQHNGCPVKGMQSMAELEIEAEKAWKAFLQMKMDPKRNIEKAVKEETKPAMPPCVLPTKPQQPGVELVIDDHSQFSQ